LRVFIGISPKDNLDKKHTNKGEPVVTLKSLPEGSKRIISYGDSYFSHPDYKYYAVYELSGDLSFYLYNTSRVDNMFQQVNWTGKELNKITLKNESKGEVTISKSKWSLVVAE
jgi:hypothetical protein